MENRLLPKFQSAYRANHSTETALLKVDIADILRAVDRGDMAVLTLLDLSAAFDTVTIQRSCVVYGHRTVSGIQSSPGSLHTSTAARCTSAVEARTRILLLSSSGSHRARSWVLSCFYFTRRTCCDSLNYTTCAHIFTLMTRRYTDFAGLAPHVSYNIV